MGAAVQDIVYAFLQTYYQRMKKDPSKVSSLYSTTAELTHINYQLDFDKSADVLPTIKLTGKENISKFFTRNNKKVSDLKAKIDTCDFQTASHSSILILTTGELFWSGTPAYRFCQTIILQPNADNKNAYDVTNDVIRFIPDNWIPANIKVSSNSECSTKSSQSSAINGQPNVEEASDAELKMEKVPEPPKPEVKSKPQPVSRESTPTDQTINVEPKTDMKSDESRKDQKTVDKGYALNRTVTTEVDNSDDKKPSEIDDESGTASDKEKQKDVDATQEAQIRPPARMSWASKLAASNDYIKSTSPVAQPQNEAARSDVQPLNNKKIAENKSESPNHRDANVTKPVKKKPQFSTVNKDGFYPIFIKGTAGVKEEKLRSVLENEFGHIMKMTTADNFAVVDFESQRSQVEALDRRQMMVGDTEVHLSRKTLKKSTGSPPVGSSSSTRPHKKHSNKKRD